MNVIELESLLNNPGFRCEGMYGECGVRPAREVACRTQYCQAELNVSPILCEDCEKEYHDYWDDMWSNVPRY